MSQTIEDDRVDQAQLVIEDQDDVTVVRFQEKAIVDTWGIERIAGELHKLTDRRRRQKLILDFARVEVLASRMLGVLLTVLGKSQSLGGNIVLCGVGDGLKKVFIITNLDKKFTFCPDQPAAVAFLGGGS